MSKKLSLVLSLFILTNVGLANAASIKSISSKDGKQVISLSGTIAEGDSQQFKTLIKAANDANQLVSGVRLNSGGGNLLESVTIAEIVRFGKLATVVANGAKCASACFVIFAAGSEHFASYSASVGVHGASQPQGEPADGATISMAKVVKDLGVPPAIIGKMVVTSPEQMVWLTPDELRSMGTTMTGKPAQVPVATEPLQLQTGSGAVAQLPQASAPVKKSWDDLVASAISTSAAQNGGTARHGRVCQPELKLCATAIFLKIDGKKEAMLRRSEDISGKMVSREICEFNDFGDIRTCVDWDSGAKVRAMKDARGSWSRVDAE